MNRSLASFSLSLLLLTGSGTGAAVAQDATPAAADARFADTLGLPELTLTITDDEIAGLSAEVEAGRYVVSLTNEGSEPWAAGFIQLAEGRSVDDLAASVGMEERMAEASPESMPEEDPLAWLFDAYIAGGPGAEPGETSQVIVDLPPGDYAVWADDPEAPQAPVALTVTGEMPTDLPEPEADVTVTEVGTADGYAFEFDGDLVSGPQVMRVQNKSDQPHFLVLAGSPEPITMDQVELLLTFDPESGATPSPDMPDPETFSQAAYAGIQSAGTTQWIAINLELGDYVAVCFVPDPNNEGIPHALEGMADVITVADG